MEVKIIEMDENFVKLSIKGEDHTFLNILQHNLLQDDDVEVAKYTISHPLIGIPEIYVRTKSKNPIDALKEANERTAQQCDELISMIKK